MHRLPGFRRSFFVHILSKTCEKSQAGVKRNEAAVLSPKTSELLILCGFLHMIVSTGKHLIRTF